MKKVYGDERLPIKSWVTSLEDGALEQAKNLANLPFLFKHVALMPDCLTEDTEILTDKGFKKIVDLKENEKICNYDHENKKVFFKAPINIIKRIKRIDEKVYSFYSTALDKNITVSENHRMAHLGGEMLAKNVKEVSILKDFIFGAVGNTIEAYGISDEELCLIAWIVGDGNIKKSNKRRDGEYSTRTIRFGLTKERKIKRIKLLLKSLNIEYNLRVDKKQTVIELRKEDSEKFISQYIGKNKEYPIKFISKLNTRQALLFLEECIKVDGDWINYTETGAIRFNSKRKKDIDFLSALISMHLGLANDNTRFTEGYKKIKMHYLSAISNSKIIENKNGFSNSKIVKEEIDYDGILVCVTCDTGYFIARQNGMTFVTGNCHQGYGMPIGGVIAAEGVVIPNAVGVDIGCGMCAVKTNIKVESLTEDKLKKIMGRIREVVPVGFNHHKEEQDFSSVPEIPRGTEIICIEYRKALKQVGTLGGGNHFIEIQKDQEGFVWIMIHSGSRNLGLKVAKYYNDVAKELNKKWCSSVDPKQDLAFLPLDTEEAKDYLKEMEYCVQFAFENRKLMMQNVMGCFAEVFGIFKYEPLINIAHNYAKIENHFGKNVVVHRKGATSAQEGEIGIIPGSQGTASYIVEGLGNEESFRSCSHGAGRKMGRNEAQRNLDLEEEKKKLDDQGIIHSIRNVKDLDEASGAYKDIDVVMENQKDLVKILIKLEPMAVIKG